MTNKSLKEFQDIIQSNTVAASTKVGAIAPLDVFVPAGNIGIEPEKTSFFQASSMHNKITRGTVEITSHVRLTGDAEFSIAYVFSTSDNKLTSDIKDLPFLKIYRSCQMASSDGDH